MMNRALEVGYFIFALSSIFGVMAKFMEGWERFSGIYDRFLLIFFTIMALLTGWVLNYGSARITGCFMTIMKLSGVMLFFFMAFVFSVSLLGNANTALWEKCCFALMSLLFYGLCLLLLWSFLKPVLKRNDENPGPGETRPG